MLGKGKEKLCQWRVAICLGGGGGGGERGVQLKSVSYILYYVHTGNSFTAIL